MAPPGTDSAPIDGELRESAFAVEGMFCRGLCRHSGTYAATPARRARCERPRSWVIPPWFAMNPGQVATQDLHTCIESLGYVTRSLDDPALAVSQTHFERQLRMRLGLAVGLGMWVMMASVVRLFTDIPAPLAWWVGAALAGMVSVPVLLYSGWPFLRLGWHGLRQRVPGMESLILLATVASVAGSLVALARGSSDVWFDVPVMLIMFQLIARLSEFRTPAAGGRHRQGHA